MTSKEIRKQFLDFFASKDHKIVPSAPIVNKDDPSLMFTNAGMNQFKDYFLGNREPEALRIADTQKCLRVSGKQNDLEEVGHDGYHHTMFEMLGNWSFGDYFKAEAIAWAWELLSGIFGLPEDRLYATVFEGDEGEDLEPDDEAAELWELFLPRDRILKGNKRDNFWEMGETGPCGPCSEIHIDLRGEGEREKVDGRDLVNTGHPQVVELWNLVFIQFNRKADGSLEKLPARHVDTGMGFERLAMALQGKQSNYDTDIFTPFIEFIERASGKKYTSRYDEGARSDIAMRVVADHIRAVAFAVADGQLPGNTGAGYVIRRILRRAVRYYYSFLGIREPFLHTLIPLLADSFSGVFPELKAQQEQVARVVEGEERAFLHTLENGLRRLDTLEVKDGLIKGADAFELYDTYGFPIDLTRLLAREKGWRIDEAGFEKALSEQKARSRAATSRETGDWVPVRDAGEVVFEGYDRLEVPDARVLRYRTVKLKKDKQIQIVLDRTPFYAESGGQAGDRGALHFDGEKIRVLDTQKENDLIIHLVDRLPSDLSAVVRASVSPEWRDAVSRNHSATHLMHAALHSVLGEHALQKGQDVGARRLRFDFSHFQKVSEEELERIENMVNEKIRENIALEERRDVPLEEAKEAGAMMLFGEKYGELVRMITFDPAFSRELCGGTHVPATGEIGLFKIVAEGSVAAGIRRIEALTAAGAQEFIRSELQELKQVRLLLKSPADAARQVTDLQEEVRALRKEVEKMRAVQVSALKTELAGKAEQIDGIHFVSSKLPIDDADAMKNLAFQLERELDHAVVLFGAEIRGKPHLMLAFNRDLAERMGINAGDIIREIAREIRGGGGGQPFFATAGGSDAGGLDRAIAKGRELIFAAVNSGKLPDEE